MFRSKKVPVMISATETAVPNQINDTLKLELFVDVKNVDKKSPHKKYKYLKIKKGNSHAISLKIRNQTNISLRWHYPNQVIGRSSQLPLSLSTSSLFHILPLI